MGLPLLVAIVVVGITMTVLAVHFTGGSKRAALAGEDHAREIFRAEHPDLLTGTVAVTKDGQSAFLALPGDAIGVVHVLGDGYLTRIFSRKDVGRAAFAEPATVSIRFRDFTWTGGHFTFADATAAKWLAAALAPAGEA
jgi:hypothetical protein